MKDRDFQPLVHEGCGGHISQAIGEGEDVFFFCNVCGQCWREYRIGQLYPIPGIHPFRVFGVVDRRLFRVFNDVIDE